MVLSGIVRASGQKEGVYAELSGATKLILHGARTPAPRPTARAQSEEEEEGETQGRCSWALPYQQGEPQLAPGRHPEERCQAAHQLGRQPQLWEYGAGTSTGTGRNGTDLKPRDKSGSHQSLSQLQRRHRAQL